MKKVVRGVKQKVTKAAKRVSVARVTPLQGLVCAVLLLVVGIGIGANTSIWNTGLKYVGLKPNVPSLDLSSLETTYETLAANYDGTIDTAKLIDGANHGLVNAAGNAYTVYFNKDEVNEFNSELDGTFSGIGAELALQDSVVTVQSVLDGSPAKQAGLATGDKITAINGQSTRGFTIDKAVSQIRGTAGTTVKLTVVRGADSKDYTITRANLTDPSVKGEVKDGIGIMTISRFGDDTAKLANQVASSFKDAKVKGVVLDLRGNGGGLVDAAQSVASLWLDNKTIVSERHDGKTTQTLQSGTNPTLGGIPTVLLIDGGSASASEIVAGALHDNGAASLIGSKSFGKGSVQNIFNLPGDNELKVTVARWYTPKGVNIDKQGITPDTVVTPTDDQVNAGIDAAKNAAIAKLNQ